MEEARVIAAFGAPGAGGGLEFEGDEALDVGGVDEGAGEIGMVGELGAVDLGGALEVFEGPGVLASAADEAAAGGFDVAEGEDMAGGLEFGFGFVKQAEGIAALTALEEQPTLVDVGDGYEAGGTEAGGEGFGEVNVVEGEVVLALLAMGAALPEVGDDDEVGFEDGFADTEDKVEDLAGFGGLLVEEGEVGFDHAEAEVVAEVHFASGDFEERGGEVLKEGKILVAEIDPLGDAEKIGGGFGGGWVEELAAEVRFVEQVEAVAHLTADERVVEATEQVGGCGHGSMWPSDREGVSPGLLAFIHHRYDVSIGAFRRGRYESTGVCVVRAWSGSSSACA
jgi:hypothetical protein